MDIGNLFHAVLEEFSALLDLHEIAWKDVTDNQISELTKEAVTNISQNERNVLFSNNASNRYLIQRITRIAEKSIWALARHLKMGDFIPSLFEHSFASQAVSSITLESKNKKFIIQGRVDRIDIVDIEGDRYVKIIDYKSGNIKFSYTDIYYGSQLQLLLYLDRIIKTVGRKPRLMPGGVFYFNIGDPILSDETIDFDAENNIEALNDKILAEFKMKGLMPENPVALAVDKTLETSAWSTVVANIQKSSKTETGFTNKSNVATLDEFDLLCEYASKKATTTMNEIISGKIDRHPYKSYELTGCDYCEYAAICKFDLVRETNKYRQFKRFGSLGEVIEEIRGLP
jgi:ATP-dependent helicase/nuclease subunit B